MSTITTTIRWRPDELARIKVMARRIGLPVALFIKSLVLRKANEAEIDEQDLYSPQVVEGLLAAKKEAEEGLVTKYESAEEYLRYLDTVIKKS